MDPIEFRKRNDKLIRKMSADDDLQQMTQDWMYRASKYEYDYHFRWLGRPIIQYPQDIVAMQEVIWRVKPDLIIETGVARGGSLVFYASMLDLLGGDRRVVGIEIDHRDYNKAPLDRHPMSDRYSVIEGSSTDEEVVGQVEEIAVNSDTILVALDSHHTHDHVLQELNLYAPFVTKGSYLVVFDGIVEEMPAEFTEEKEWGPGNNPKTAVKEFLETTDRFEIDRGIENKLMITVAPSGYLRCIDTNSK